MQSFWGEHWVIIGIVVNRLDDAKKNEKLERVMNDEQSEITCFLL